MLSSKSSESRQRRYRCLYDSEENVTDLSVLLLHLFSHSFLSTGVSKPIETPEQRSSTPALQVLIFLRTSTSGRRAVAIKISLANQLTPVLFLERQGATGQGIPQAVFTHTSSLCCILNGQPYFLTISLFSQVYSTSAALYQ